MSVGDSGGIRSFGGVSEVPPGAVTTDGVTIIGDGSPSDPLIALPQDSGGGTPASTGTYLVSGANVAWSSAYIYRVGAATYYLDGTLVTSAEQTVTATSADATYDRIDAIVLNSAGTASIIAGTASPAPASPYVDPTLYLQVSFIYVVANTSVAPVTATIIYANNAEWTMSASAGTINVDSTNNPRAGTKCVEGTAVTNGQYFTGVAPAPFDLSLKNTLVFFIYCKASWANKKSIQITWSNSTNIRGRQLVIGNGQYGFNSGVTGYQQIVVPITDFIVPAGTLVDRVQFAFVGTGASIGFYIDDISMQAGFAQGSVFRGNVVYRGTWASTASYETNDLVTYLGKWYMALGMSTNVAPTANAALWNPASTAPVVTVQNTVTGNVTLDWAGVDEYQLNLNGNFDIIAMNNMVSGKRYMLRLKQNGSGNNVMTLSMSNKRFSVDTPAGDYVLSTAASLIDRIGLVYDGSDSKVDFVAINKGFA